MGLFNNLVSYAFANESMYGKSVSIYRASTYKEYFGQNIFTMGSKMYRLKDRFGA